MIDSNTHNKWVVNSNQLVDSKTHNYPVVDSNNHGYQEVYSNNHDYQEVDSEIIVKDKLSSCPLSNYAVNVQNISNVM